MDVVFQGEFGANSHMAVAAVFPNATPIPSATFEECFLAVEAGNADRAMIPIENSSAGRVADIHWLLPRSTLRIVGEYFMPVHFHLMALPGASLTGITSVESHVHALGQCRRVIRKYGLLPVVASDTAGAALCISRSKDLTRAALAPRLAAEYYNLDILLENVEDSFHNTTRFVILSREGLVPTFGPSVITTVLFEVRNIPSALFKALGAFATNNINLTKIESFQLGEAFMPTTFLIDIDGHPETPSLCRALEELRYFSGRVETLGVYLASDHRKTMPRCAA